jgi:hypothetical protein
MITISAHQIYHAHRLPIANNRFLPRTILYSEL